MTRRFIAVSRREGATPKRKAYWTSITPRNICGPWPTQSLATEATKRGPWIQPLPHQLKHGGEAGLLESLGDLLQACAERDETTRQHMQREAGYFTSPRDHLHYQQIESQGCPIGSGATESTCSPLQDRFKRTGQFWTLPGEQHLLALELARHNLDWDEIWRFQAQQC